MVRPAPAIALVLALAALLIPPLATAAALAGGGVVALPVVAQGVWIFKLMLLVHAVFLGSANRIRLDVATALGESDETSIRGRDWALLGAALLVGAVLRFRSLGAGLWYDEIQTLVSYVRLPLGRILTTFDSQNQHPVYSISAHLSVSLLGESAAALRLPAALFGIASLGALYWFARQVTDRLQAGLALVLVTVSYHHIWFSQNARGYTSLLLWVLVGSGIFLRMLTERGSRGWGPALGYALSMALATYTHITAVFVVAAHAIIWAARRWTRWAGEPRADWRPFLAILLAGTFSLQLYALVLPQFPGTFLAHPTVEPVATAWKSPAWLLAEAARGLSRGIPGGWFAIGAALLLVAAGTWGFARRDRLALLIMLLPVLVSGAAIFALNHNLWPRFFFFAAGFVVLIVIRGGFLLCETLFGTRARSLALAGAGLVILASAWTVPGAWRPKQDYEGAASYIKATRAGEDAVVTVDLTEYPYAAYYGEPWTAVDSPDALSAVEQRHPRTWVLFTFPIRLAAVEPEIWRRLQTGYDTAAVFPGTVGGGTIVVMVSRAPLPPS